MFIRKYCKYKDNATRRTCVHFKLKIQTKNMFSTKYFTNYVAQMSTKTYQKIWLTKRFEKHSLPAKTRISEKFQTLRYFY